MSHFSSSALAAVAALAFFAAAPAGASQLNARVPAGAHASVARTSETDIRKQCAEEARARWGVTNQDMQRNRDYAASTCMVDHGIRNP